MEHAPQQVQYPHGDEAKLKFKDHDKQYPVKFYLVFDYESFLVPSDEQSGPDAKTRIIDEHRISGFCCYRVTDLPQFQTPPRVYSGPDVMTRFYEHVMTESETVMSCRTDSVWYRYNFFSGLVLGVTYVCRK